MLLPKWIDYFHNLSWEEDEKPTDDEIKNDLNRRINIQGNRPDMHFELLFCDDVFVGFANFAISTGTLYGLLEAGYGCVMEFYISPEFRRKGYGKLFYEHIEKVLKNDGTQNIFLTPDPSIGKAFWPAMGFNDSNKIDPDNNYPIYLKNI
jgi:GNAT superfamily N-acetyltransferase